MFCIFIVEMIRTLRVFIAVLGAGVALLAVALFAGGCSGDPSLEGLGMPEFVSISAQADDNSLVLTCNYKGRVGMCGFVVTRAGKVVKRQDAETRGDGSFTLTVNGLEYDTEYTYYAWISNGSTEIHSNTDVARTEKEPHIIIPDANFKAYCVENFDTNGDGEISEEEARRVTVISFYSDSNHRNIKSLKGIEHFKNLVQLN